MAKYSYNGTILAELPGKDGYMVICPGYVNGESGYYNLYVYQSPYVAINGRSISLPTEDFPDNIDVYYTRQEWDSWAQATVGLTFDAKWAGVGAVATCVWSDRKSVV